MNGSHKRIGLINGVCGSSFDKVTLFLTRSYLILMLRVILFITLHYTIILMSYNGIMVMNECSGNGLGMFCRSKRSLFVVVFVASSTHSLVRSYYHLLLFFTRLFLYLLSIVIPLLIIMYCGCKA
jgi:hypothetical protein